MDRTATSRTIQASKCAVLEDLFAYRLDGMITELGNLRSTTATVDENFTSKYTAVTWLYHKSFAIIQSRSRPTMWAKYSKNKLVRAVSKSKTH